MIIDRSYLEPACLRSPEEARYRLRTDLDSPGTLVLVFSGLDRQRMSSPVRAITAAFPQSVVAGCSTAGEVVGSRIRDGGIAITVVRFARTELTTAYSSIVDEGASAAGGADLGRQLRSPALVAALVFSDGISVNGSQLLRGLNDELDGSVVVTGGLAGDGDRFAATWVIADGEPRSGVVAAVGLNGDALAVGHGSGGGWDIFGPQRVVTRSDGNVVFELDGRSALDLYKQYLGDLAAGLPASGLRFPLAIKQHADDEETLVRTLLGVNHEDRSLIFAGDVPTGWRAQLMRANFERLIEGAEQAAAQIPEAIDDTGGYLALAISCVGRRLVLKDQTEEELEVVLHELPPGARLVGFYSYGEISPVASGRCELHNQTMTLTTLAERQA